MKKTCALLLLTMLLINTNSAKAETAFEEYSKVKKGLFLTEKTTDDNSFAQTITQDTGNNTKANSKSVMSIEQIVAAYNEGKFIEIVDSVKDKAAQDSIIAQKILGKLYKDGKGIDKNPKEAARWFAVAAEAQDTEAQLLLGTMLYEGDGIDKDVIASLKWLKIASLLETDTNKKTTISEEYFKVLSTSNRREKTEATDQVSEWLRNKGKSDLLQNPVEPAAAQ